MTTDFVFCFHRALTPLVLRRCDKPGGNLSYEGKKDAVVCRRVFLSFSPLNFILSGEVRKRRRTQRGRSPPPDSRSRLAMPVWRKLRQLVKIIRGSADCRFGVSTALANVLNRLC